MQNGFQARVWIVIERAEDVPGEWVAHCLDFDVVMQGRDPRHALEMAKESVEMIVVDDLAAGHDPRRRRAPEEYWLRLSNILDRAEKLSALPEGAAEPAAYVVEIFFFAVRIDATQLGRAPLAPPAPYVEAVYALPEQRAA